MRTTIAFILAALFAGTAWAAQPTGEGGKDKSKEAAKGGSAEQVGRAPVAQLTVGELLSRVEERTPRAKGGIMSGDDARQFAADLDELKKRPDDSTPLLISRFIDRNRDKSFRLFCHGILLDRNVIGRIAETDYRQLAQLVGQENEDTYIRISAANLLLRGYKEHPEWISAPIKAFVSRHWDDERMKGAIRGDILRYLKGDVDVENHLIERLPRDSHKDSAIYVLGKIKSRRSIEALKKLLDSGYAGRDFHKTRVYLALGDIGGEDAFDRHSAYRRQAFPEFRILEKG